jgi:branched-chain amino acid transport system substrate-binding protein
MRIARKAVPILLVACLMFAVAGCGEAETEANEIKIGVIGPMFYVQGEHHYQGAQLAASEINDAGGIQVGDESYRVTVVKANSNELVSVTDATGAMEKLINVDDVDFVMGGIRTEAVLAMQDIAMDNQRIFLGCGAATTELCTRVSEDYDRYKYWFRVLPANSYYLGLVSFELLGLVAAEVAAEVGAPKVAILAEQAVWANPIVDAAEANLPGQNIQVVGTWRVSATADQVTSELTAIENAGANIIFTVLSGPVGLHYAKKRGELQIPAASVGINVEAQDGGFWDATGESGNYEATMNLYARVEITEDTIAFYDKFVDRVGGPPTYNAGTYEALYILKAAIERAGTLDSDAVVAELENTDRTGAAGRIVFTEDHDLTWGPGYVTAVGVQWLDGEMKCIWPPPDGWQDVVYEGAVEYELPPWIS